MKYVEKWQPTKYVMRKGQLRASHDTKEIGVGSRLMADRVAALYAKYLPRYARGRLLDLGCGKVPLYMAYRDTTTEVVCVDWEGAAKHSPHLDLAQDITEELPFDDGSFDTIIVSDVMEHIPEPASVWAQLKRLLAPGGHILLNVPYYYPIHEAPYDFYRYTEFALRRFAEAANLEVVVFQPLGGSPEVIADIVAKNLVPIPVIGPVLASFVQSVVALVARTGPGAKLSAKTAQLFPLGYFLIAKHPDAAGNPSEPRAALASGEA